MNINGLSAALGSMGNYLFNNELAQVLAGVTDEKSRAAIQNSADALFSKVDTKSKQVILQLVERAAPNERASFFATLSSLFMRVVIPELTSEAKEHHLGQLCEAVLDIADDESQSVLEHTENLANGLDYEYLYCVLPEFIKSITKIHPTKRQDVLTHAKPMLQGTKEYRDMQQLIGVVAKIPPEERAGLAADVCSLSEGHSEALRVTTLEALKDIKAERADVVTHVKSFVTGHKLGHFCLSDAIYQVVKIAPDQREDAIKHAKPLLQGVENGVARCEILRVISLIAAGDREEVIRLAKPLFQYFKDPLSWAWVLLGASKIASEHRKDVLEKSVPMLQGLYDGSHIGKIFSAIAAIAPDERQALIEQAMPLLQDTNVPWYRGESLRAIAETAPDERDELIYQARNVLLDKYWLNDSIATFLRIVATTDPKKLEVLLNQARALIGNTYLGDRVDVLLAVIEIPIDQREGILLEIAPLLQSGGVDNTEIAGILRTVAILEPETRRILIQDTALLLNTYDPQGRLALLQAVHAIPPETRPGLTEVVQDLFGPQRNIDTVEELIFQHQRLQDRAHRVLPTLEEVLSFWTEATNDATVSKPNIQIDQHQDSVIEFLLRLKDTAEYENKNVRALLAQRVIHVMSVMAQNEEIRSRGIDLIFNGITSCDDRIISALDQLELMIQLYEIEHSNCEEEELRKLGKSFLLLDMVNEKVTEFIKTLSYGDEIELRLVFQILLADRFSLPIQTRNMLFREHHTSRVTDEQIAQFGNEIEAACTEEKIATHLATWGPWMDYQRRQVCSQIPSYDSLPTITRESQDDSCPISQETPTKPVYYNGTVYDYDEFIKCYRSSGKDPMNGDKLINLQELKRIVPDAEKEKD